MQQMIFYCGLYAVLNVAGASLIKSELLVAQPKELLGFVYFLFRPKAIVGFGVILCAALVMFKALAISQFSLVGPIATGVNFVLTVFIGVLLFQDKLSFQHYFGLLLIFAGILTMAVAKSP